LLFRAFRPLFGNCLGMGLTLHKRVEHFVAGFRRFRFDLCLRKTETGRLSQ
jgi:hypothetical protein